VHGNEGSGSTKVHGHPYVCNTVYCKMFVKPQNHLESIEGGGVGGRRLAGFDSI
jgi:hypothetical protein